MELTAEQGVVADGVIGRVERGIQQTAVGGWAGTGKSVLLQAVLARLEEKRFRVQVCAPTHKACEVLRAKGVGRAKTLHSYFTFLRDKETKEYTKTWADGSVQKYKAVVGMEFGDRAVGSKYDVLLVDESSMVDRAMYRRILDARRPVVFFGDHGQLPPFGAEKPDIMEKPDFRLEAVHRNAGEVARFAAHLRRGGLPRSFTPSDDSVQFGDDRVYEAEQVIVGRHTTRLAINRTKARHPERVSPGDRLISLKTDKSVNITKGSIVTATGVSGWTVEWADRQGVPQAAEYDPQFLLTYPSPDPSCTEAHPFDFGWAITCNSAQGSEWASVAVVDESFCWVKGGQDQACAWRYTAATRAKKKLWWMG